MCPLIADFAHLVLFAIFNTVSYFQLQMLLALDFCHVLALQFLVNTRFLLSRYPLEALFETICWFESVTVFHLLVVIMAMFNCHQAKVRDL